MYTTQPLLLRVAVVNNNNKVEEKEFTLSVFTENKIGLLTRVTNIFTRRKLNIESLTASECEIKDVYRFIIVVKTTEEKARKLVQQLEKQVEVLKALYYHEKDLIFQEVAMFKLKLDGFTENNSIEKIIRQYNARIIDVEPNFVVVEMTGHKEETQELFEKLKPFGLLQFVRSGRIAIMKPMKTLKDYLDEMDENFSSTLN